HRRSGPRAQEEDADRRARAAHLRISIARRRDAEGRRALLPGPRHELDRRAWKEDRQMVAVTAALLFAIHAQPVIDRAHREVRITAIVQPDAMSKWIGGGVRGHHAVTWSGGNAH